MSRRRCCEPGDAAAMSRNFFRFPLRALARFDDERERLEKLVGYCVMDTGRKLLDDEGESYSSRAAWELGCELLNVNSTGTNAPQYFQKDHDEMARACGTEKQAKVTIATSFFWNCLYGLRGQQAERPLSYREFSVLCAVLSKTGDKPFASCSWREIQRRALGYAGEHEMTAHLAARDDKAAPLSRQQIRDTLDTLARNRFLARYAVGNGRRCFLTYFSVRMSEAELAEAATAHFLKRRKRQPRLTPEGRARAAALWQMHRKQRGGNPPENPG